MKPIKLVELNILFDIIHGNKLDLNKMVKVVADDNAVAFVGRSGTRNGIVATVKPIDDIEPHKAGGITVALGGAALSSFVQPRPFYTAQNIDVLKPKKKMSLEIKLYYCLCIEANSFRYSTFGREANRTLNRLLVPSLESVPNWAIKTSEKAIAELKADLKFISGT